VRWRQFLHCCTSTALVMHVKLGCTWFVSSNRRWYSAVCVCVCGCVGVGGAMGRERKERVQRKKIEANGTSVSDSESCFGTVVIRLSFRINSLCPTTPEFTRISSSRRACFPPRIRQQRQRSSRVSAVCNCILVASGWDHTCAVRASRI